jgi:hypothetical protein
MDGGCVTSIKEIHTRQEEILDKLGETQKGMSNTLERERKKILETFEEKIREIQDQLRKDEEKKKDN